MSLYSEPYGDADLLVEDDVLRDLLRKESEESEDFGEKLDDEITGKTREFIEKYHRVWTDPCSAVLKTSTAFNVDHYPSCQKSAAGYDFIINLKNINDTLLINELFSSFNKKLRTGGTFIGCVETYQLRKKRLLKKYPFGLNYVYYFFDYSFKRVFPKIKLLNKLYFFVTAGRKRAISETEALGRLNYCGFKILETITDDNRMYFAVKKVKQETAVLEKGYHIFLRLPRQGKGGKSIQVYKLRTMFPYAEYIQDYVYNQNQLQEGGKFKNDFRISLLGRFLRKYFLDEVPMLLNLVKGELKLVGVRPLSNQYLSLYSQDLIQKRMAYKPGLIPPYYADLPKTIDEIQESEARYLDAYERAPLRTDVRYFFMALQNIVFRKARSK